MNSKFTIDKFLDIVVKNDGSDLHITVGRPPTIRLHGRLRSLDLPALEPDDTLALMKSITSEKHQQELNTIGGADFSFSYRNLARFRVSILKQKGNVGIVLRLIPSKFRTFEELGLPPVIKNLLFKPRGLVLVTGPTGSGKTTTLATMLNFINDEVDRHIITIEDPIEYVHAHKKSVITQREIGVDVPSFAEGIRRALRQDPDVVLIGEMRDLETTSAALTAAETGHLVFGTLHTTGASRTVDRIIDQFPPNQQEQVRSQLSTSLAAVISQVIMPTFDGQGRVAAFEIMFSNSAIENYIRKNESFRIPGSIQTSRKQGMILLDDYLYDLYTRKIISYQEMITKAQQPNDLAEKIKELMGNKS